MLMTQSSLGKKCIFQTILPILVAVPYMEDGWTGLYSR